MPLHKVNAEFFGEFAGGDLDILACEALLRTRWPRAERNREPELMQTKWWDYRLLHPVHATYLFAHTLDQELRAIIRGHLDNTPARETANGRVLDWHAIKPGDVFEPPVVAERVPYWKRKILGLIRARQTADADGIPYNIYAREGLRHYYLGGGSYMLGRSKIPEPNLLYSDACLLVIRTKWLEQIQMKVQASAHPSYQVANDDGHPDRDAHRRWLDEQLAARSETSRKFARPRLVKDGVLPPAH